MLAEEVLPLVLIENGRGPKIFDGREDFLVPHRHGVCLVEYQVVGLPLVLDGIVRLIEQGENVLPVHDLVQDLLGDVHLVDHDVVVVGILGADDDAQLVDQRDL